jgi:hypothetical protein
VFIDPTNKREHYYQFIVNSKGVSWDAYHNEPGQPDKLWEPKCEIQCKVGKESWIATMALPYTIFDRTDKTEVEWAFNVARTRTADSESVYWSPVFASSSHKPERFGKLLGMPAKVLKK